MYQFELTDILFLLSQSNILQLVLIFLIMCHLPLHLPDEPSLTSFFTPTPNLEIFTLQGCLDSGIRYLPLTFNCHLMQLSHTSGLFSIQILTQMYLPYFMSQVFLYIFLLRLSVELNYCHAINAQI